MLCAVLPRLGLCCITPYSKRAVSSPTICSITRSSCYSLSVHLATLAFSSSLSSPAFAFTCSGRDHAPLGQTQKIKFGEFLEATPATPSTRPT